MTYISNTDINNIHNILIILKFYSKQSECVNNIIWNTLCICFNYIGVKNISIFRVKNIISSEKISFRVKMNPILYR